MSLAFDIEDPAGGGTERSAGLHAYRPVPRISIEAFCETDAVARQIAKANEDRRMAKTHAQIHMGGVATAVEMFQTVPTPNLILLETSAAPRDMLQSLSALSEVCDPSTKVVIIGHFNDVALYRELIRNGISEYMIAPIELADIIGVIGTLFVDPEAKPLGSAIAFIGAKGGVGASTLAHNIAWSISSLFKSEVVIADMDLPYGTANINFDQDPAQGIAEAVFSPERIDDVYLDRLLAQCAENLSLLAAPSTLDRVFDFRDDSFAHLIDVAQRSVPHVILDVPHSWNGWTRTTLARADEVVIVASPELANLRNTKNLLDTLKQLRPNDAPPRLILNQVGVPKRPEIAPLEFCGPLGIPAMATLPFEPALFGSAANNGRMLAETDAANPIVQTINEMAHILTGRMTHKARKKPGLKAVFSKLTRKK
ncbi:pilus assembly protein CpaE [Phyllobacterium sp. YR620]|uniref:AAA family ATPase n=1 Tax=Phyllobacterium TaxID=28100 RepID=UPI0008817CAF|nr:MULTISPECIES: AAA family ATPase [unclassified Phyllobacterium]UGY10601.1 AAA family ATPase [Phyllobacterium sp. T1018]SDP79389.1 pilus assembly protein CpaE [Phyllobacterium sp. YR620]